MAEMNSSSWQRRLWRALRGELFWGLLISILALWVFASLADNIWEGESIAFDSQVIGIVHNASSSGLTTIMLGLTMLGDWRVLTALGVIFGIVWWRRGQRSKVVMLTLAYLGGAALDQLLKVFFHRMRPETAGGIITVQGYSFPSGHAMMSLCFYGMLIYLLVSERSRLIRVLGLAAAIALIGAIGLSRIYLGVHYPSDIVGGFTAGFAWLMANILGYRDYQRRQRGPARRVDTAAGTVPSSEYNT
ncbi:MAG: phosphatase PAP2 family protein [Anaerolineae bacterium]